MEKKFVEAFLREAGFYIFEEDLSIDWVSDPLGDIQFRLTSSGGLVKLRKLCCTAREIVAC